MPNISLYFVRHGQRIDQVDRNWAQSSPCPQDPPLTDLGKNQARQTGKIIRDFALESSSNLSCGEAFSTSDPSSSSRSSAPWSVQRITPPESPDLADSFNSIQLEAPLGTGTGTGTSGMASTRETRRRSGGSTRRPHHFAIVTSPFLRCSQTAIEMAIGIRSTDRASAAAATAAPRTAFFSNATSPILGDIREKTRTSLDKTDEACERDQVTIAVESGLAGKVLMRVMDNAPRAAFRPMREEVTSTCLVVHCPRATPFVWPPDASQAATKLWRGEQVGQSCDCNLHPFFYGCWLHERPNDLTSFPHLP